MIFLSVGNWHKGFDRLVKAVDDLVAFGVIVEQVISQIGYGSYQPKHLRAVDFCSPEEFEDFISQASIIISHAGMGTIIQALKKSKPIIVVPRRRTLGENINDHQFDTARAMESEGKILVAYEVSELPDKLRQAESFTMVDNFDNHLIIQAVEKFLTQLTKQKGKKLYGS